MTLAVTLGLALGRSLALALLISRHAGRSVCGARRALEVFRARGICGRPGDGVMTTTNRQARGTYQINSSWKAFCPNSSGRELSTNAGTATKTAELGAEVCAAWVRAKADRGLLTTTRNDARNNRMLKSSRGSWTPPVLMHNTRAQAIVGAVGGVAECKCWFAWGMTESNRALENQVERPRARLQSWCGKNNLVLFQKPPPSY
jgi:hypothetical protein